MQEMLEDSVEVINENNAQKDKIFRTQIEMTFNHWKKQPANQEGLTEKIIQKNMAVVQSKIQVIKTEFASTLSEKFNAIK